MNIVKNQNITFLFYIISYDAKVEISAAIPYKNADFCMEWKFVWKKRVLLSSALKPAA